MIYSDDMYPNDITIWTSSGLSAEGQPTGWTRTTQKARVNEFIEKKYTPEGVQTFNMVRVRTSNNLGENFSLVVGVSISSEPLITAINFVGGVTIRDLNSEIVGYRYEAKK